MKTRHRTTGVLSPSPPAMTDRRDDLDAHAPPESGIPGTVEWSLVEGTLGAAELELVPADSLTSYERCHATVVAAIRGLREAGARLIIAEYPDSEELVTYGRLLREVGFEVEATVPDYVADDVALRIAVMRLA